jgi:hypothetical protein
MIGRADAGVCDQDIDWPKLLAHSIRSHLHGLCITNISHDGNGAALHATDNLVQQTLPPSQQTKTRPASSNRQRQTSPDPGRGTGNHDGLVCPETRIIAHISFDISHLSFSKRLVNWHQLRSEMTNEKCQMINDK